MAWPRSFPSSLVLLALAGCASAPPPPAAAPGVTETPAGSAPGDASATTPAEGFPIHLVTGPGSGPALYRAAAGEAIGFVSSDVTVEVAGPPENDRVPVRIRGPLKVRAYLDLGRLAGRVQRRGRVRGTPVYVAGGDLLRVLGFEGDRARVAATAMDGTSGTVIGETYVGTYPLVGLGPTAPAPSAETVAAGSPHRLPANTEVQLFEEPGGRVIAILPARSLGLPCSLVREQGGMRAVLVGTGPFLAGYVGEPLTPANLPMVAPPTRQGGTVPERLREDPAHPLVRVRAGTRVRFEDQTIAVLDAEGWARELARYGETNEVDVFVAVDDHVAVRGMVEPDALVAAP